MALIATAVLAYALVFHVRVSGTDALVLIADPTELRPRGYCLLNPFRDTEPERVASELLARVRDFGPDELAAVPESAGADRVSLLESELRFPISSWRVADRRVTDQGVQLSYWVKRGNGYSAHGYEEEVIVIVSRLDQGWSVCQYEAIF